MDIQYILVTFILICELLIVLLVLVLITDRILETKIVIPKIKNLRELADNFAIWFFNVANIRPITWLLFFIGAVIIALIGLDILGAPFFTKQKWLNDFANYFGFVMLFVLLAMDKTAQWKTSISGEDKKLEK